VTVPGAFAVVLCYIGVVWKGRMGYDDSLDVMGIHGMDGIVGILATRLFSLKTINAAGVMELFCGNTAQFAVQTMDGCGGAVFRGR